MRLSYAVRFSSNFNFVLGGKLPGLYGGIGNTGGNIPDGTDGFSTRYMWGRNGVGEVYAYLPTSQQYGTGIGRGNWRCGSVSSFSIQAIALEICKHALVANIRRDRLNALSQGKDQHQHCPSQQQLAFDSW